MNNTEYLRLKEIIERTFKGGAGSGNFGHEGRPGEVGGSSSGGSVATSGQKYSSEAKVRKTGERFEPKSGYVFEAKNRGEIPQKSLDYMKNKKTGPTGLQEKIVAAANKSIADKKPLYVVSSFMHINTYDKFEPVEMSNGFYLVSGNQFNDYKPVFGE